MKLAATLSAAALLAAPVLAQVQSQSAKAYSDRLTALTDLQRRGALRRAVLDSGSKCPQVVAAVHQGTYKNLEMWVVRCAANPGYAAFLGPDGSVQVSTCTYLATVRWPACRKL